MAGALEAAAVQTVTVQATDAQGMQATTQATHAATTAPAAVGAGGADMQQQAAQAAAATTAVQGSVTGTVAQQQQQSVAAEAGTTTASATATVDDLFLCEDKLKNSTIVEQLPQLKIQQVLDSNKPRSPQDVTLVTQLSFERLYMLEGQCDVWNGVISAAVYIALLNGKVVTVELNSNQDPRLTDITEVERKFKQFHQLAEAKGAHVPGLCMRPAAVLFLLLMAIKRIASSLVQVVPLAHSHPFTCAPLASYLALLPRGMQGCASWTCSW